MPCFFRFHTTANILSVQLIKQTLTSLQNSSMLSFLIELILFWFLFHKIVNVNIKLRYLYWLSFYRALCNLNHIKLVFVNSSFFEIIFQSEKINKTITFIFLTRQLLFIVKFFIIRKTRTH